MGQAYSKATGSLVRVHDRVYIKYNGIDKGV